MKQLWTNTVSGSGCCRLVEVGAFLKDGFLLRCDEVIFCKHDESLASASQVPSQRDLYVCIYIYNYNYNNDNNRNNDNNNNNNNSNNNNNNNNNMYMYMYMCIYIFAKFPGRLKSGATLVMLPSAPVTLSPIAAPSRQSL